MAWDVETVELLRVMVNDLDAPRAYTDEKLMKLLCVAAFQVQQEVSFGTVYEISVSDLTIEPDFTEGSGRDDGFANLVSQKAACIADRGAAVVAAQRAISVRDGGSAVDLRGVFAGKLALLSAGWCAVYADTKLDYQRGQVTTAGAAVMTPFRQFARHYRGTERC